jgi:hypothetical protein
MQLLPAISRNQLRHRVKYAAPVEIALQGGVIMIAAGVRLRIIVKYLQYLSWEFD